jgi:hypothetical protein
MPARPRVRSVLFGYSPLHYDRQNPRALGFTATPGYGLGTTPAIALNRADNVLAVHDHSGKLRYRIALLEDHLSLNFHAQEVDIEDGHNPAVALNNGDVAIVMFDVSNALRYRVGKVIINQRRAPRIYTVDFQPSAGFPTPSPDATDPSVAVNDAGIVVEVHKSGSDLYWRRGKLDGQVLTWHNTPALLVANGSVPSVSINNNGVAVCVYQGNNEKLFYSVGTFDKTKTSQDEPITWTNFMTAYVTGGAGPAIAITDDNYAYAVHQQSNNCLQAVGIISGTTIDFRDFLVTGQKFLTYDVGRLPNIATNGRTAVQVHQETTTFQLFGNASLIFDRANWMEDSRTSLGNSTLRQISIPASHDSGAFEDNRARTQDIRIRFQLRAGVRYFDLRPKYTKDRDAATLDSTAIVTYHDIPSGDYLGPKLKDVIENVRGYMQNHKELVILKISHFKNFNQKVFDVLADLIVGDAANTRGLAQWLFPPPADTTRLAERKLSDYLKIDQGTVLIVVDVDTSEGADKKPQHLDYITAEYRTKGLFRYRDWYDPNPADGDITVLDVFSETIRFDDMSLGVRPSPSHAELPGRPATARGPATLPVGQLPKFAWFDGKCQDNTTQCDLFLLSWTLTPRLPAEEGNAFFNAREAVKNLVAFLNIPKYSGINEQGFQINLLYTDAVEYSRSADVAVARNGLIV